MIIEYEVVNEKTIIHTWRRDNDGKKIHNVVDDFLPYFYVEENENVPENPAIVKIENNNFVSIFNEKLKKIYVKTPSDVKALRTMFKKTYEADILFTNRYLIDRVEKLNKQPWHIVFIDIEILSKGKMPSVKNPEEPICLICVYSNFLKKYFSFVYVENNNTNVEKLQNLQNESWEIKIFYSEFELLKNFIDFLISIDFDIITGWNIQNFDLPYLFSRCDYYGIKFENLSCFKTIKNPFNEKCKIPGRIIFDLMKAYKFISEQRRSYSLSYISQKENLSIKKDQNVDRNNFHSSWQNNIENLIKYNKTDVEILVELDKKLSMFDYFDMRRMICHSTWNDVLLNSRLIDNFILKKYHNKIVFPTKPRIEKRKITYEGAIVISPRPGLHENIANFDVSSMYPNIIISFNISPETFSLNGEIIIDENHKFKKEKGLIPSIFDELFELRKKYQNEMQKYPVNSNEYETFDKLQANVKYLINSIYGYLGFQGSRLYNKNVAESVTLVGRETIKFLEEKCNEYNVEIIYADTDGIYVKLNENATIENYEKLLKKLNNDLREFFKKFNIENPRIELKFEKLYSVIFFYYAKKRYAGHLTYVKGKTCDVIEIVGLEAKRSDNSDFGEFIQQKVLEMILHKKSKDEIINFLRECVKKIKNNEIPIYEIGIPKLITKSFNEYKSNTPWVRGSLYSNKYLFSNFGVGSKVKLIYVKSTGRYPRTDVICFDDEMKIPEDFKIDSDKMIELNIIQKISRIFNAFNWNINEIFEQKTLQTFFT
jgi:DNA polymerase I